MYYRRYSGVDSRDSARCCAVRRRNPRPGEELRSWAIAFQASSRTAVGRRCNSGRSILQRRTALGSLSLSLLFSLLYFSRSLSYSRSLNGEASREFHRSLILSSSHNWSIREANLPIDRCSCYVDLNETSDAGRCDPFILSFPAPFSTTVLRHSTLSISTVDLRLARCRSNRRIYNLRE